MPVIRCPYYDTCHYETADVGDSAAASLLIIHNNVHIASNNNNVNNNNATRSRRQVPKIDRPKISRGSSEEVWNSFTKRWTLFKRGYELSDAEAVQQLFQCCDDDLGDAILKSSPTAVDGNEANLLTIMKQLAVIPVAVSIRRSELLACRQDHGESGRAYYAKLMGKAATCSYTVKCSSDTCDHVTDFTDIIVKDVLVSGVADEEIKQDLLGWAELDAKDLNSTVAFLEAKEMARDALNKKPIAAGISNYKKSKTALNSTQKLKIQCKECKIEIDKFVYNKRQKKTIECTLCFPCWQKANPKAPKQRDENNSMSVNTGNNLTADEECSLLIGSITDVTSTNRIDPAMEHLQDMVDSLQEMATNLKRMRNSLKNTVDADFMPSHSQESSHNHLSSNSHLFEENAAIATDPPQDESATIHNTSTKGEIVLDHHIFKTHEGWRKAESMAHPTLRLRLTTDERDYKVFEGRCPDVLPSWVTAVTDTGAQSCLWSLQDFYRCGFQDSDLLPVRRSMVAANSEEIVIVGAVFLRLSGIDERTGITYTAAVMAYVSPSTKKLYLPREALIQLKVISKDFPKIGAASEISAVETKAPCGCPLRALPPDRPTQLPFTACPENNQKMKEWLRDRYAGSTFNKCPHQQLKGMSGPPLQLHIDESMPHKPARTPAMVPLHDREEIKRQLDEDVALGVLERVPHGETSKYCHRMVVTRKADGTPRRTIDMSSLNKATIRETHHVRPPFQQARSIPHNTWKTATDAWNGYHSIPLHTEDIPKTTFITPWGTYRYKMAPQGSSASGDGYTRRFDEIIADIPRKTKCVDDTVQWDSDLEEHWWRVIEFLKRCGKNGIVLNYEKFQFCQREIEFAGFKITNTDVKPLEKYLKSIIEYPTPTKTTDIRAWFGLVNQVSHYAQLTELMEPFRPFLSKYKRFEWNAELDRVFESSKSQIVEAIKEGVQIYDINKPTCLQTDWSNVGIGYFLSQKHCSCDSVAPGCCEHGWRITLAGSRFLKPAESRYVAVEGEALAIAWALENTKFFTQGCDNLVVVTDHKPLIQLFEDRALDQINNPRLFNLKQATLLWKFSVVHKSGKENHFADATSRSPASDDDPSEITKSEILAAIMMHEDVDDDDCVIDEIFGIHNNNVRAITWDMVREETNNDHVMQKLLALITSTFPSDKSEMPAELLPFWNARNNLYVIDGVILMNDSAVIPTPLRDTVTSLPSTSNVRIIVPENYRTEVISTLHSAHQGVSGMNERAKIGVYWPGITKDIQDARDHCTSCNNITPSQAHLPPTEPHIPTTPFESIACDYFKYKGHYYLVAADRLSGWIELQQVKVGTNEAGAEGFCKALRRLMVTFGVPVEVSTDWGPEFKGDETQDFFNRWGIHHRRSSSYNPSSNGRAELGVKTGKRLLMENIGPSGELNTDRVVQALLTYRNTPEPGCKLSPAQILLGRPLRDTLPYINKDSMVFNNPNVHPRWRDAWAAKEDALKTRYVKTLETLQEHSRPLPPLRQGEAVIVQNQTGHSPKKWDRSGVVVETKNNDQYVVKMSGSGRLTLRNRRFLRKCTLPTGTSIPTSPIPQPLSPVVTADSQVQQPVTQVLPAPPKRLESPVEHANGPLSTPRRTRPPTPHVVASPPTQPTPPARPIAPTPPHRLTFEEFDAVPTPQDAAQDEAPQVVESRRTNRSRPQRQMYDANTGLSKKPTPVPDDV